MTAAPGTVRVLCLNEACYCAQVLASDGWITLRKALTKAKAEGYLELPPWTDAPRAGVRYIVDYPGRVH